MQGLVKGHAVGRPVELVHQILRVACLGLQVFDGAVFVQSKFLLAIDFRPEEWYTVLAGLLVYSIGSAALVSVSATGGGIFDCKIFPVGVDWYHGGIV